MPTISVIIPARPGTEALQFRETLKRIHFPPELTEILLAEGLQPSLQRNEAAFAAKGEIIYFLDDDSVPDAYLFQRAILHYASPEVSGVGGPAIPHTDESFLQKCFSTALISPFGGFGIAARYRPTGTFRTASEKDLILCNFSIRKSVFLKYGGFDSRLYPNEENEFFNRLLYRGEKLFYDPEMVVARYSRSNYYDFFMQIFRYGRGRMEHLWLFPASFSPLFFIPLTFLCYCVFLFLLKPLPVFSFIPLLAYLVLNSYFSARGAYETRNLRMIPALFASFLTLHTAYGMGSLYGIVRGGYLKFFFRKERPKTDVIIRVIKPLM